MDVNILENISLSEEELKKLHEYLRLEDSRYLDKLIQKMIVSAVRQCVQYSRNDAVGDIKFLQGVVSGLLAIKTNVDWHRNPEKSKVKPRFSTTANPVSGY